MLKIIEQIFSWLKSEILRLLILAGVLLLLWGTFSPVGTLVWWFNSGTEAIGLSNKQPYTIPVNNTFSEATKSGHINCYIVYLPGVGDFSADELDPGEDFFLHRLAELHPSCVAVSGVFPYSADNEGLGAERLLGSLWRAADHAQGWFKQAKSLIKIRNLWRFAISADTRYGPIYNQGIAKGIINCMNATYPIPNSGDQPFKLILAGTSGGVEVALGAATYLDRWLNTELIVVSMGGDFDGNNRGLNVVDHMYQLRGSRDWIQALSAMVFPSRWKITVRSPFNQAVRQGRYTVQSSGPHTHFESQGYFGEDTIGDGKTRYVDLTLDKVNQLPIWNY